MARTTPVLLTALLIAGLSWLVPQRVTALGRFDIKPILVTFLPGEMSASVEITNDGATPQELEIGLKSWTQADEEGESTDDLVVSPSIFVIAPGKTQLVRLGPTHALQGDVERSYRLVATEVPPAGNAANVQALLRMRLPVFIAPKTAVPLPLTWHVARDDAGQVAVSARNDGNVHQRVRSLRIDAGGRVLFDNVVAAYVLGHQSRRWLVALPAAAQAQAVRVVATEMDGTRQEATFDLR